MPVSVDNIVLLLTNVEKLGPYCVEKKVEGKLHSQVINMASAAVGMKRSFDAMSESSIVSNVLADSTTIPVHGPASGTSTPRTRYGSIVDGICTYFATVLSPTSALTAHSFPCFQHSFDPSTYARNPLATAGLPS